MFKNFEKLAQANVDHYNQHPAEHAAITAGLFVGAVVGFGFILRKIVKENPELKSGKYAK